MDQKKAAAKMLAGDASKKTSLLAEVELTTKEQRKADWGIIKEMSKYLWPKVGVSILFLAYPGPLVERSC